ncbi:MAG TPA: methylenetetrahydrofolate--tRNA-(uracil(54)-C(5))-methyltransferase (FADH(2)-oxidizing) TrmFO [Kiritimatiellia bacterium]|nr:methylenetetrahydrofolate--tRNA-(uracil(54)-C(5))-methyltransferase (FADH(2)-oxidizing) TrmFO [Kiritimatiellia bacterium]HQQ04661.1 methylenetetrahydrofolate--tRNA-(uracil(54)-C(5))-methyltransferase (FADH(2)-oxidizing) TrmFO [Kiritimatiellia bacterium]
MSRLLTVAGGGLAGSEAAWQAARQGIQVRLYEMRPDQQTPAHVSGSLAELVCSNSLGSALPDRATGLLQNELRAMGSLLMRCADACAVPAGGARAVDRAAFAGMVTGEISGHPNIRIIREEVTAIPEGPAVIATGPLTSSRFSDALAALTGREHFSFFDALAPLITADSINMDIAFRASRYGRGEQGEGDYINCPLNREEYDRFVDALIAAERIPLKTFEEDVEKGVTAGMNKFFEGCLPVEILARRGRDALAFGPMRPIGLDDPRTGRRPRAILQLRQDNVAGSLYNMVGFQTNLRRSEQERVFRMIPGLEGAEFARHGQMHRNTFLAAPALLNSTLQMKEHGNLFIAGQLTGVEGYAGSIGTGLLAGLNAARLIKGGKLLELPQVTMLGALVHYITHADLKTFQPMKANFGIMPALETEKRLGKQQRGAAYAERALAALNITLPSP